MGQANLQKTKWVTVLALVLSVGLMTACEGSNNGRSKTNPNTYDQRWYTYDQNGVRQSNCTTCGYSSNIADIIGQTNTATLKMEMGLTLFDDSQNSTSGSVSALGYMQVYENRSSYSNCALPLGDYEIQTLNPGTQYGVTMVDNIVLEAYNLQYGIPVIIEMSQMNMLQIQGYQGADGFNYGRGFWGYANVIVQDPQYGSCSVGSVMINTPDVANLF